MVSIKCRLVYSCYTTETGMTHRRLAGHTWDGYDTPESGMTHLRWAWHTGDWNDTLETGMTHRRRHTGDWHDTLETGMTHWKLAWHTREWHDTLNTGVTPQKLVWHPWDWHGTPETGMKHWRIWFYRFLLCVKILGDKLRQCLMSVNLKIITACYLVDVVRVHMSHCITVSTLWQGWSTTAVPCVPECPERCVERQSAVRHVLSLGSNWEAPTPRTLLWTIIFSIIIQFFYSYLSPLFILRKWWM